MAPSASSSRVTTSIPPSFHSPPGVTQTLVILSPPCTLCPSRFKNASAVHTCKRPYTLLSSDASSRSSARLVTGSVTNHTLASVSAPSRNRRMLGWRRARSLRKAMRASGNRARRSWVETCDGDERSNEKTETGDWSSCGGAMCQ